MGLKFWRTLCDPLEPPFRNFWFIPHSYSPPHIQCQRHVTKQRTRWHLCLESTVAPLYPDTSLLSTRLCEAWPLLASLISALGSLHSLQTKMRLEHFSSLCSQVPVHPHASLPSTPSGCMPPVARSLSFVILMLLVVRGLPNSQYPMESTDKLCYHTWS